jgi:hypothetical protein
MVLLMYTDSIGLQVCFNITGTIPVLECYTHGTGVRYVPGKVTFGRVVAQAGFLLRRPGFELGSDEICGGHSCTGAGFLQVLRFPLSIFPLTAAH